MATKKKKEAKSDTKDVKTTKVKTSSKKEENKKKVADKKQSKTEKKVGLFTKIKTFFKEVKKEMSYVKWPSKKDMVKYSMATIGFVLFFSIFFYVIDLIVAAVKTWV